MNSNPASVWVICIELTCLIYLGHQHPLRNLIATLYLELFVDWDNCIVASMEVCSSLVLVDAQRCNKKYIQHEQCDDY